MGAALPDLVDDWIRFKRTRTRRGLSVASETAYRADLAAVARRVADALGRPVPEDPEDHKLAAVRRELSRLGLDDLTEENLATAFASLVEEGYAAATRQRMLAAWRGWCRWLARSGHLALDPTAALETPTARADSGDADIYFSAAELERIVSTVATPDEREAVPWPARDLALVALLGGTGARASEVIDARVGALRSENGSDTLHVVGKGGKRRTIPVAPEVVAAVASYLDDRTERLGKPAASDPLFVRADGRALNRQALDYLVEKWLRRAGVSVRPGELAHAFRHTYAVHLVQMGVALPQVQALLGHVSLTTTARYLKMTGSELQEAAQVLPLRRFLAGVRHGSGETSRFPTGTSPI
ncbi:MAG TPA: tyrosine-type recombinase/integrase [Actinomycetota bacterium]|nr:tyrosine-type recombinase/integrase [Actinomycetota bacterium]